ncbi:MAG: hypothetical protein COB83_00375 [Gammaproteobacteria bacterium]|nr:MAG: hypothetical protein COB83_00375 [Gammaproteobacteria bacterium]
MSSVLAQSALYFYFNLERFVAKLKLKAIKIKHPKSSSIADIMGEGYILSILSAFKISCKANPMFVLPSVMLSSRTIVI